MRYWLMILRKQKGLTQEKLATQVNVSRQMISAIEHNGRRPSVDLAMRIADVLDFDWSKFYIKEATDKEISNVS